MSHELRITEHSTISMSLPTLSIRIRNKFQYFHLNKLVLITNSTNNEYTSAYKIIWIKHFTPIIIKINTYLIFQKIIIKTILYVIDITNDYLNHYLMQIVTYYNYGNRNPDSNIIDSD